MARTHLLLLMALCILIASLQANMKCSCKCCKSLLCIKPNYVSIYPISKYCSESSCKAQCKRSYPEKCGYKLGKVVPTCERIITTTTTTTTTKATGKSTTDRYFQWYGAPLCDQRGCFPAK